MYSIIYNVKECTLDTQSNMGNWYILHTFFIYIYIVREGEREWRQVL